MHSVFRDLTREAVREARSMLDMERPERDVFFKLRREKAELKKRLQREEAERIALAERQREVDAFRADLLVIGW